MYRIVLFQCRDAADPMLPQEVDCFREFLPTEWSYDIRSINIPYVSLVPAVLNEVDMIFIGGSGEFSVIEDHPFLPDFFSLLTQIVDRDIPMFASCFGFHALTHVLGGRIVHDDPNMEYGTYRVNLTAAAKTDPVFGSLPESFLTQSGHKDRAEKLPSNAIVLAYSDMCAFHAYRLKGKRVYATQFHPELSRDRMLERLETYAEAFNIDRQGPQYQAIMRNLAATPEANSLLPNFVRWVVAQSGQKS